MLILQDFEAITPNLLARTIETIEDGGIIVILLRAMSSLKQFCTMSMDVQSRFRTESHQDVIAHFNERFLLSLSTNKHCLVVDDQLNILPISSKTLVIKPIIKNKDDLLCLNCCQQVITPELRLKRACPIPESCDLYYIDRDALFSYHKISELFLQHIMSVLNENHYENSPNDLQMLSDAPAHHLFCLLEPLNDKNSTETDNVYQLPEILCVVQVCLEGGISKESVVDNLYAVNVQMVI
jgi:tRNA(Met) C34 N-acetyltransferase TmcA